jgi:hypothetical protein
MSPEDALQGAKSILDKHPTTEPFGVRTDNPNDCVRTIAAFKKLGCRVKIELDGARLVITRRA